MMVPYRSNLRASSSDENSEASVNSLDKEYTIGNSVFKADYSRESSYDKIDVSKANTEGDFRMNYEYWKKETRILFVNNCNNIH